MACLLRFAEERSLDNRRLHIVSLGQGQGVLAEEKIRQAVISGDWVILQNCHLCTSWMPTLERICQTFKAENIHPDSACGSRRTHQLSSRSQSCNPVSKSPMNRRLD